jgi:hypothetical protein
MRQIHTRDVSFKELARRESSATRFGGFGALIHRSRPPLQDHQGAMTKTCDTSKSAQRLALLASYMERAVLGPRGFCCGSANQCRESAMAQKQPVDFATGQLSHVGKFYDIKEDAIPLRILVIGMETGRTDSEVSLQTRRRQVLDSAALMPQARNPHMIGVTHVLRTLHGKQIGLDPKGEILDLDGRVHPAHIFDAYAMANVRLCTSVKAGTTQSRPTRTMTENCVRHLEETIRILEPTVCVVQSTRIPKAMAPIVASRKQVAPHLAEVQIGGVQTLIAEFSHPTAYAELNWGRWTNMPYLDNTVVPTLLEARTRLGLS